MAAADIQNRNDFEEVKGLPRHVAQFVTNARYEDLSEKLLQLGNKSILDGLGLALAGSVAKSGEWVRQQVRALDRLENIKSVTGQSQ